MSPSTTDGGKAMIVRVGGIVQDAAVADTLIQAAQPWAPETRKQKTTGPHVVNRWQTCACVCMRVCVCVRMHVLCLLSMASWGLTRSVG